jgi:hypothetical protein
MAGSCNVVSRTKCEHSQGQKTRQRMQALGHVTVPSRTNRTNHDPCGSSCPEDITPPLRKGSVSATAWESQFNRAYRRACQIVFDDRPRPTLKGLALARLRHHATWQSARCLNSKFTKLNGKAEPEGKAETPEDWRPFSGDRVALRFSFSCARSSQAIRGFGAVH